MERSPLPSTLDAGTAIYGATFGCFLFAVSVFADIDQRLPNSRFMSRRPSLGLWFGRRSRLWHQEPHNRDSKQAYRCHTQKCCRPIKVRGDEPKECSAERSTKS